MNYDMGNKNKSKSKLKINHQIKKSLYNWIMHHLQVVQSPIFNDSLKVNIDGHTRLHFFQNCYCRCPSKNFITTLLVTQYMMNSKRKEIQRITSLSVILHYVHYFHPNFKKIITIKFHVWL